MTEKCETLEFIAEKLEMDLSVVEDLVTRVRTLSSKAILMRYHKENLREDYFEEWDEERAYYLGYIFADGWILCKHMLGDPIGVGLKCKRDDEDHILRFRNLMGSRHSINRRTSKDKSGVVILNKDGRPRECTEIVICSSKLAWSLVNRGVLRGKSLLNLPFPVNVPPELLCHFVRGHFDGDGSCGIYLYEYTKRPKTLLYYLGSELFIHDMKQRICSQVNLTDVSPQQNKNSWYLQWQNLEDIRKIYHWMYPSQDIICLPRKRLYLERMLAGEIIPEITITDESELEVLM